MCPVIIIKIECQIVRLAKLEFLTKKQKREKNWPKLYILNRWSSSFLFLCRAFDFMSYDSDLNCTIDRITSGNFETNLQKCWSFFMTLSFSTEFVYFLSLVSFRHGFSVIYFLRSFMLSIEKIPTWHIGHPHNITQYQWLVCVRLATIITNQNRTFHLLSNRMGHFSSSNFSHWAIWISLNKWLWFTRC